MGREKGTGSLGRERPRGAFLIDELLTRAGLSPGFHPTNTPIPLQRSAW